MSRYTFNPKLDPNRNRNRRFIVTTIVVLSALVLAVALVVFGASRLIPAWRGSAARPSGTQSGAPLPKVTILAPQPTAVQAVSTPQPATAADPAAPAATAVPMDPRGKIAGIDDFVCQNPRNAPPANTFGYGIQSNWPVGDIGLFNSIMAEQLKLDWTKGQVRWNEYEKSETENDTVRWQYLDAFVGDANKKGLNILLGIIDAPPWTRSINEPGLLGPPDDYKQGARFFQKVAARYKGCVQAIEVWNEMNLDREWRVPSGKIEAAEYVRYLTTVVPAIREIDPNLVVVMGALSPTGATGKSEDGARDAVLDDYAYMDAFVAAGGPALVDCIGVHLNGFNMPPDKRWNDGYNDPAAKYRGPFDNPNHSWSFLSTMEDYYAKTKKPLCVTEFGWASMDNLKRKDGTPTQGAPTGFDFALDNTEQEQADWIVQGFQIMKKSGYVRFGIVFNLDYIQKIGDEPDAPAANVAPYSITRRDGSPRPAFEAIKAMPR
jgi:polysaccharide biosynthesis protein PslG